MNTAPTNSSDGFQHRGEANPQSIRCVAMNFNKFLEMGKSSSDYIQLYHGNAALLAESLEVIQRTSAVILGAIQPEAPATESETVAEVA